MTSSRQEWVTDPSRFEAVRDHWNGLAAASPFLAWEWLDCWWGAFGGNASMRIHLSWDGPALAAGMAFALRGRHLRGMADRQSDLYLPVMRSAPDLDPVLDAVAGGPWSRITLPGAPASDSAVDRLVDTVRAHGWLVHGSFRELCPIIDTRGSFDDYERSLSSNARRQIKKAGRRLAREGRLELSAVERVGELGPVLAESFSLEAAGWKGRSKSAILASERLTRFWRALFERYQTLGTLRFSELRLDGSLIAFCLGVMHGRRLYTLKTSYDERYSYFSPGHLLRLAMVESCFEQGIEAQELLGPMLRWKQRYATEARETAVIRAYRGRRPAAIAYGGRRWLMPALRPAYQRARHAANRARGRRGSAVADPQPDRD